MGKAPAAGLLTKSTTVIKRAFNFREREKTLTTILANNYYNNKTITEHFPFCCYQPLTASPSWVSQHRFGVKIHICVLGITRDHQRHSFS